MVETQRCCWYLVEIILRERNADIQSSYDVITCTMAIGCDSLWRLITQTMETETSVESIYGFFRVELINTQSDKLVTKSGNVICHAHQLLEKNN